MGNMNQTGFRGSHPIKHKLNIPKAAPLRRFLDCLDHCVMKLKDVIRLEKTVVNYGRWLNGEIDRASWPLRRKKLKFSPDWQWRVVFLRAGEREFRVLLQLNPLLEKFHAMLGEVRGDQLAVLCSHDLHTSHSNWHCHVATGDIDKVGLPPEKWSSLK